MTSCARRQFPKAVVLGVLAVTALVIGAANTRFRDSRDESYLLVRNENSGSRVDPNSARSATPTPHDAVAQPNQTTSLASDPAHETFRAELQEMAATGAVVDVVEDLEAAIGTGDYGISTRYLVYLLRFIGGPESEGILHEVIETEIPDDKSHREDPAKLVASGLIALEDVVGRIGSMRSIHLFAVALEDLIATSPVPHVRITAARIYLNHVDDRREGEARLRRLLGSGYAYILDIADRYPESGSPTP